MIIPTDVVIVFTELETTRRRPLSCSDAMGISDDFCAPLCSWTIHPIFVAIFVFIGTTVTGEIGTTVTFVFIYVEYFSWKNDSFIGEISLFVVTSPDLGTDPAKRRTIPRRTCCALQRRNFRRAVQIMQLTKLTETDWNSQNDR